MAAVMSESDVGDGVIISHGCGSHLCKRSNRRELWLGTDMAGAGARRAAWNEALLREGVASAYAQTLLHAAEVGRCVVAALSERGLCVILQSRLSRQLVLRVFHGMCVV